MSCSLGSSAGGTAGRGTCSPGTISITCTRAEWRSSRAPSTITPRVPHDLVAVGHGAGYVVRWSLSQALKGRLCDASGPAVRAVVLAFVVCHGGSASPAEAQDSGQGRYGDLKWPVARASAQTGHNQPDIVVGQGWRPFRRYVRADATRRRDLGTVSTTADNQILVELARGDTAPAKLFDLNKRTVVFAPDGHGRYTRAVRDLIWEGDIGTAVEDGAEIDLGFRFDFAGRRWSSFFVSRHGAITFGERLTYRYSDSENRFDPVSKIAAKFVTTPTISPLYKPMLGGPLDDYGATQHVAQWLDRVVVTWVTTDPVFYRYGVPPARPSRFQLVLSADGTVTFNYGRVAIHDGVVGLFANEEVEKGRRIVSIVDPRDPELPAHLDLLETAVYESSTGDMIVEWRTRGRIRTPPRGTVYSYRLYFDTDPPYLDGFEDVDFVWQVDLESDERRPRGGKLIPTRGGNRLALLIEDDEYFGISAGVAPDAAQFDHDQFVQSDWHPQTTRITLPRRQRQQTDLSRPDRRASRRQSEVFYYRGPPDPVEIACRVVDALGDEFDVFVFHSEFRVDSQEAGTPVRPHYGRASKSGTGIEWRFGVPCGEGRLKAIWQLPVWMRSGEVYRDPRRGDRTGFEAGLLLFFHEFTHAWTAHAAYDRNGQDEPLHGNYCRCHWREDLHLPAAFPWDPAEPGPRSSMGGRFWRENADGTFTPLDGYWGGGPAWLDLYMMGLARADEVPDMFVLRNLKPVSRREPWGPHTGDKEVVTIEQVVAAEGLRQPRPAGAQKNFNAAFVYLLAPGRTPDDGLLRLHAEYRDAVLEHWRHVTGGRSRMFARAPRGASRSSGR